MTPNPSIERTLPLMSNVERQLPLVNNFRFGSYCDIRHSQSTKVAAFVVARTTGVWVQSCNSDSPEILYPQKIALYLLTSR